MATAEGARGALAYCLPRVLTRLIVSHLHTLTEKNRATDGRLDPYVNINTDLCSSR